MFVPNLLSKLASSKFASTPAASPQSRAPLPPFRRLRGYAFDPSLATQLENAVVNRVVFRVPWEPLERGPAGEYVEVIDVDPASRCHYDAVDLNDPHLLAQDGLPPSEGDPRFHQQMVYAVAMTTIENFERALGRTVFWAEREGKSPQLSDKDRFVKQLRIYPHALREANAYYSPDKVALLFGYFTASAHDAGEHFPGGMVFSCLSHDIIAHETTHAILDGMHHRYLEASHPDVPAFHEAFADIVALFQHFSFPEVLRHQIARSRGDLRGPTMLGQLAAQFGRAMGGYGALRSAIGQTDERTGQWKRVEPDPKAYENTMESHDRGALLVAAVFDAFLAIYERRTADLLRIASSGTGVLPAGQLHPDLVNRLAREASKAAQHVLTMCVRALDYAPPVDITFGDYLRAIITADSDLVPNDDLGYRVAFIEAFRRRGLYPRDVRTLSEESLCWQRPEAMKQTPETSLAEKAIQTLALWLRTLMQETDQDGRDMTREQQFHLMRRKRMQLHDKIWQEWETIPGLAELTGLVFQKGAKLEGLRLDDEGVPRFQISSISQVQQVGPDGDVANQVLITLIQTRDLEDADGEPMKFRGGCTLVIDLKNLRVRYAIKKPVFGEGAERRLARQRQFMSDGGTSVSAAYFGADALAAEPFALLHRSHDH
jgi:hypothetical protein